MIGHIISSIIVIKIDVCGSGHHDAFDFKLSTVLLKCAILFIPDNTNIENLDHSSRYSAESISVNKVLSKILEIKN